MKTVAKYLNSAAPIASLLLLFQANCGKAPPSFKLVESAQESSNDDSGNSSINSSQNPQGNSENFDPKIGDQSAADRDENYGKVAATWNFMSSSLTNGSLSFNISEREMHQHIKMDDNVIKARSEFRQINRPLVTEVFQQGTDQESNSEKFVQNASPKGLLDILIVVDNSKSMKEEQENLSKRLLPLLNYVKESDWKIAVVTTDPLDGCLRTLIAKGDLELERHFASAIQAGTQGSGNERGILQAVNGLKNECNGGSSWIRSNSTLAVLIVSDEDNCSTDGQECKNSDGSPAAWAKSNYLVDYLKSIRQIGINARTYGLIWHPTMTQTACSTGYHPAAIYSEAIAKTSGTWGSICDTDYSNTLKAISLDLSRILQTQFALQFKPIPSTLKVYVNDQLQKSGFNLSGNVIKFSLPPAAGSKISVTYDFAKSPRKQQFTLSQSADSSTLEVFLDGAVTKNYTFNTASKTIDFDLAPEVKQVRAIYRTAGQLESTFFIERNINFRSISVAVNGINSNDYSYNPSDGSILLKRTPPDQALIQISFEQIENPRLRYQIYSTPDMQASIKVIDANTKKMIPFLLEDEEIVFKLDQFKALREIVIIYPESSENDLKVNIGLNVISSSIEVKGMRSGLCDSSLLNFADGQLNIGLCKFAANESISINFSYASSINNIFDLGELKFDPLQNTWRILVNGLESKNYTLSESQLKIEHLPLNAKIEVQLYQKNF